MILIFYKREKMKLNLFIIMLLHTCLFAHGGGNHSHARQSIGSVYGSVDEGADS